MKSKTIFLLIAVLFFVGCSNDNSVVPSKEIKGSLFVSVKTPDGMPVKGASIDIGDLTGSTDEYGTYFFTQITLTGDDYLRVVKAGYFKGSRRFKTLDSHTQFLSISLLPQVEIGNFNSSQSASISIDANSKLTFPDNAITRANGSAYNGNVRVFANPIYGDDPLLSDKMPGDLTGLDQSGTMVVLASFGMVAVELESDSGEDLQIAPGKTVELLLGISNQQLSTAPATIPLWYFDEAKGYWVQEGQAIRVGNAYVGQLPHFSFWNCDIPATLIDWQARFIYEDGRPAQNTRICLTNLSINDQRCSYTDANGLISGGVPANEILALNVTNECVNTLHTQVVGPFSDDARMEAIVISEKDVANISGNALQCNGSPLTTGFVRVRTAQNDFIFPIQDGEGYFEGTYIHCSGDVVTLQVYDVEHALVSLPEVITFDRDLEGISLSACDEADEFIRYQITGFTQEYIYYLIDFSTTNVITKISSVDSIGVRGKFGWSFDSVTTGQYKGYTMSGNQINLPNGQIGYVLKMDLNVTEYGEVGQYIRGNFSGKINVGGNGSGGPGDSDFNGTFSVKNE